MSIVEQKAVRLLAEGRVTVVEAGCGRPGRVLVRGDHAEYMVEVAGGYVSCPCPSWRPCSHRRAVSLIIEVEA